MSIHLAKIFIPQPHPLGLTAAPRGKNALALQALTGPMDALGWRYARWGALKTRPWGYEQGALKASATSAFFSRRMTRTAPKPTSVHRYKKQEHIFTLVARSWYTLPSTVGVYNTSINILKYIQIWRGTCLSLFQRIQAMLVDLYYRTGIY